MPLTAHPPPWHPVPCAAEGGARGQSAPASGEAEPLDLLGRPVRDLHAGATERDRNARSSGEEADARSATDAEPEGTAPEPDVGGGTPEEALDQPQGATMHDVPQHPSCEPLRNAGTGGRSWAPLPAIATCRPREAVDDGHVRSAPRICPTLVEHIGSDPREVREVLKTLCGTLLSLGLDTADCMTLEIVLAEALNNIVEHAYRNEHGGWIQLELDYLRGWVVCGLTDGGLPMPGNALPPHRPLGEGIEGGGAMRALPEGGFGWSMIYELTSELRYRRVGTLNTLCFALPLTSTP